MNELISLYFLEMSWICFKSAADTFDIIIIKEILHYTLQYLTIFLMRNAELCAFVRKVCVFEFV